MNVRLSAKELRLRLDKEDLAQLLQTGEILDEASLGVAQRLTFGVRTTAGGVLALASQPGRLVFEVPRSELEALSQRPPAKDLGLYGEQLGVDGGPVRLALEVDLFSLRGKR